MSYQVNRYSSDNFDTGWPLLIGDNVVNSTYGVNLLGRGVTNYGELVAENFVFLLENFAGNTPPPSAITGQLWFDTDANTPGSGNLRVFDGNSWTAVSGAKVGSTPPTVATEGELFYQISQGKNQLLGYSGGVWNRIGGLISAANAPTPANDGDLWLDLSIPSNTTPDNTNRILKIQVSGAWYPIGLGDPSGGSANNTGTYTSDNLVVMQSNGQVMGVWSSTVRSAPASLATIFPNGLQIGLNLSNIPNNKILNPTTGSRLSLGGDVQVNDDLWVVDGTNTARLTVTGASNVNTINANGAASLQSTLSVTGRSTFNNTITVLNGFVVESFSELVAAGTTQATATPLSKQNNIVSGNAANAGVSLPSVSVMPVGAKIYITNTSTTNKKIYPNPGAQINGQSVNVPVDIGADGTMSIIRISNTGFRTLNAVYSLSLIHI